MSSAIDIRRRRILTGLAAVAGMGLLAPRRVFAQEMISNAAGNYRFLPGNAVFCTGVLPAPGFQIHHVLFQHALPLAEGYAACEAYLRGIGRPVAALCGMELRVPAQMSFPAFRSFNAPYIEQLRRWGLVFGESSAVCRTNVAPGSLAPAVPSLHAFSYTTPATSKLACVAVSGTADIDTQGRIVAAGDTSPAGMAQKLEFVFQVIDERLRRLGFDWQTTTHVDLYLAVDVPDLTSRTAALMGQALPRGYRVYHARPPIDDSEVELEARAVAAEWVLDT